MKAMAIYWAPQVGIYGHWDANGADQLITSDTALTASCIVQIRSEHRGPGPLMHERV